MSFTTFVSRRYLQAGRSNRFMSWISILTISGVAIGVAAMIVVWSVINGFETQLRKRFLTANAHIMLYSFPNGLNDGQWHDLKGQVEHDYPKEVAGVAPFVYYETMARKDSILHGVLVHGIIPKLHEHVQTIASVVTPKGALAALQDEVDRAAKGAPPPVEPAIIAGSGLLTLLDAKIGDTVELVRPTEGSAQALQKFKVAGAYDSGLKHYDNKLVLMSVPTGQTFFGMGHRVTGLEIGLTDPWNSPRIAADMRSRYDLSATDWLSLNHSLFEAINVERPTILLITAIVPAVAGFNILTTIFVAVSQRQRDISILKALGASNRQIMTLFLKQGVLVGVVGSVIGVLLALGISALLERYQFIDLPDLYLLARLPITYDWHVYGFVASMSLLIAAAAGLFPAWMASRIDPAQGFRGGENAA